MEEFVEIESNFFYINVRNDFVTSVIIIHIYSYLVVNNIVTRVYRFNFYFILRIENIFSERFFKFLSFSSRLDPKKIFLILYTQVNALFKYFIFQFLLLYYYFYITSIQEALRKIISLWGCCVERII